MRKAGLILTTFLLFLIFSSGPVLALQPPWVTTHGGEVSLMVVGDRGLVLGGEYGFTDNLAISGRIGGPFGRLGIKVQARPALAVIGGVTRGQKFYFGFTAARSLNTDFLGIAEAALVTDGRNFGLAYQVGVRYRINPNWDLRGGVISQDLDFPNLQVGGGYSF